MIKKNIRNYRKLSEKLTNIGKKIQKINQISRKNMLKIR